MGYDGKKNASITNKRMKVAIIIVNWNTGPLLARCLSSLQRLPEEERALLHQVWIVDNNSSDTSLEQAQAAVGNLPVSFMKNARNLGFARANNLALKQIPGHVHVLLLNPDTEVRAGALRVMLSVLDERPQVGIVGPKLVNPDNSLQGSVRPFPRFLDFVFYMLKLGRIIQARQEQAHDYSRAGYADQVMGAAFLIRAVVLRDIGRLDEGFFTLFEEVDFAWRARQAGWRTYYTPAAVVMHVRAASFNQLVGWRKSLPWLLSCLHYASKHLAKWQTGVLYALVPVSLVLVVPATLKHLAYKYVH